MSVDTKLKELIINTLSPEQMPENPSDTEIYLVEDNVEYQEKLIPGANITIVDNVISATGGGTSAVESVNGKTGTVVLTGEDISADVSELTDTVQGHLQTLHDNIKDIELFKFPNATIIGEPIIDHGQVSGFSESNYLQFPFIVDLHNQPFVIDFCFTTGNDVTTQQNILDSQFGLALAIANGRGLMAISHNGTSWAGSVTGTMAIQPNTTYYARLSWNRINYQTQLSTDGTTYVADMNFGSTQSPYPRTVFIGGCSGSAIGHTAHPFGGTINLNYAYLTVAGNVIWQGMDDAGLSTRADVSLGNLDEFGQAKFDAKQDVISDLGTIRSNASSAKSTVDTHVANTTIHVTAGDKIAWSNKQNKLTAGENITIDESTNTISATGGGSGSGRNIGDIFYTTRTDTALAGAVECNGGTYDTRDYAGEGSIGELLATGKLDYISLSDYATAISTKGWCDKIGWDGGSGNWYGWTDGSDVLYTKTLTNPDTAYDYPEDDRIAGDITSSTSTTITVRGFGTYTRDSSKDISGTIFRVPTLTPKRYVVKIQEPTAGNNYTWYRLYNDGWIEQGGVASGTNGTITFPITMISPDYQIMPNVKNANITSSNAVFSLLTNNLTTTSFGFRKTYNAGSSAGMAAEDYFWQVSGQSAIVSDPTERAMFQLFNATTDEAVATVGTVVAQVGENTTQIANRVVKGHELIDFQIPTAANGYTWYRKYADGWVEQGGIISGNYSGTITYPVEMANTEYFVSTSLITNRGAASFDRELFPNTLTTTGMTLVNFSGGVNRPGRWQVSGISA